MKRTYLIAFVWALVLVSVGTTAQPSAENELQQIIRAYDKMERYSVQLKYKLKDAKGVILSEYSGTTARENDCYHSYFQGLEQYSGGSGTFLIQPKLSKIEFNQIAVVDPATDQFEKAIEGARMASRLFVSKVGGWNRITYEYEETTNGMTRMELFYDTEDYRIQRINIFLSNISGDPAKSAAGMLQVNYTYQRLQLAVEKHYNYLLDQVESKDGGGYAAFKNFTLNN